MKQEKVRLRWTCRDSDLLFVSRHLFAPIFSGMDGPFTLLCLNVFCVARLIRPASADLLGTIDRTFDMPAKLFVSFRSGKRKLFLPGIVGLDWSIGREFSRQDGIIRRRRCRVDRPVTVEERNRVTCSVSIQLSKLFKKRDLTPVSRAAVVPLASGTLSRTRPLVLRSASRHEFPEAVLSR